jgi:hypothetical protein
MQCPSCATDLPQGAKYCPNCGSMVLYNISDDKERQRELLVAASAPHTTLDRQATIYSSSPNGVAQQTSSSTKGPARASLPPPATANPLSVASQPSATQVLEKPVSMLPPKTSEMTESTSPSLSRPKATLLLYCLTVVGAAFLVGSVLNSLGFFPPAITTVTSAFGGTLAAMLGVLGGLLAGSILKGKIKEIWLEAKRPLAIVAAILTVGVLLMVLFLNADPYLHRGVLALDDPLRDNSLSYNWNWSSCAVVDGTLHVNSDHQYHEHYCTARTTNFRNFVYEVQMTIVKGNCGGLVFRQSLAVSNPHYYDFRVCSNGSYSLQRYDAISQYSAFKSSIVVYSSAAVSSIHVGLKEPNLLAVTATSSGIELWANMQRLVSLPESTYTEGGFIGVEANETTLPTEVTFSNAKVWNFS